MKHIGYLIIALIIVVGCASTNNPKDLKATPQAGDTVRIANDSLEYEIIIIEPGFNNWLATQQPRGYYEQFWLENRNQVMVYEYNRRVRTPFRYDPNIYQLEIDYRPEIDYGYEVNYMLYNWFQFFQQRNKLKLR